MKNDFKVLQHLPEWFILKSKVPAWMIYFKIKSIAAYS